MLVHSAPGWLPWHARPLLYKAAHLWSPAEHLTPCWGAGDVAAPQLFPWKSAQYFCLSLLHGLSTIPFNCLGKVNCDFFVIKPSSHTATSGLRQEGTRSKGSASTMVLALVAISAHCSCDTSAKFWTNPLSKTFSAAAQISLHALAMPPFPSAYLRVMGASLLNFLVSFQSPIATRSVESNLRWRAIVGSIRLQL